MHGRAISLGVGCVVAMGTIAWRFVERDTVAADLRATLAGELQHLPDAAAHADLYAGWMDQHFDACYAAHMPGGGRAATRDEVGFVDALLRAMADTALAEGYTECEGHLRALRWSLVASALE